MLRKQLRLPLLGIIITLAAVVVLIALRDTLSTQLFGATRTTTPQDAAAAASLDTWASLSRSSPTASLSWAAASRAACSFSLSFSLLWRRVVTPVSWLLPAALSAGSTADQSEPEWETPPPDDDGVSPTLLNSPGYAL